MLLAKPHSLQPKENLTPQLRRPPSPDGTGQQAAERDRMTGEHYDCMMND